MYVSQLLHPSIFQWTSRLLPCPGFCKCNEHSGTCVFLNDGFLRLCAQQWNCWVIRQVQDFPGGSDGKESTCNAGDSGLIPGLRRSPGDGTDYPLQYSCLEHSMDRGAWQATVRGITKSWTRLSDQNFSLFMIVIFLVS